MQICTSSTGINVKLVILLGNVLRVKAIATDAPAKAISWQKIIIAIAIK